VGKEHELCASSPRQRKISSILVRQFSIQLGRHAQNKMASLCLQSKMI
jgi:hypothetical protein